MSSVNEDSTPQSQNSRSRGYNIIDKKQKDRAIKMVQYIFLSDKLGENPSKAEFKKVSRIIRTSIKNLKRWFTNGTERKKGCGRKKLDPLGEKELVKWAIQTTAQKRRKVSRQALKMKALELINFPGFQASKGYLDKFVKQTQLKKRMNSILHETFNLNIQEETNNDNLKLEESPPPKKSLRIKKIQKEENQMNQKEKLKLEQDNMEQFKKKMQLSHKIRLCIFKEEEEQNQMPTQQANKLSPLKTMDEDFEIFDPDESFISRQPFQLIK